MVDIGGNAAADQIVEETMAVRRHGDQIALFALGRREYLDGRIARGENGVDLKTVGTQFALALVEVCPVTAHLVGLAKALLIAGQESIGNVDDRHACLQEPGEGTDVGEDRLVGLAVLERDQNVSIHLFLSCMLPIRPATL